MNVIRKAIESEISSESFDSHNVFRVTLSESALADMISILRAVLEGVAVGLVVAAGGASCMIQFSDRGVSVIREASRYRIMLDRNSMEYIERYLLEYYANHFASVDHIDIEGEILGSDGYLVIKAQDFLPPVSADEARRRLGE